MAVRAHAAGHRAGAAQAAVPARPEHHGRRAKPTEQAHRGHLLIQAGAASVIEGRQQDERHSGLRRESPLLRLPELLAEARAFLLGSRELASQLHVLAGHIHQLVPALMEVLVLHRCHCHQSSGQEEDPK